MIYGFRAASRAHSNPPRNIRAHSKRTAADTYPARRGKTIVPSRVKMKSNPAEKSMTCTAVRAIPSVMKAAEIEPVKPEIPETERRRQYQGA